MRNVFLDHQSATPLAPEVWEAMRPYFTEHFGNPSSLHQHGLRVRDALAQAREQCATLLNAESAEDILFTSGGTEAVNLAIKGTAEANRRRGNHFVVSAIEHPAVLNSIEFLEQHGFTATRVPVDALGRISPDAVRAALTEQTVLVCVHQANHDIGTLQPVREIGALADERGLPLFVDATISGGWLPLDVQALGASLVALAPHRFYGPKGVGVLYRQRRARLHPIQHGGTQEGGRRAGTENVPAIVGAGAAAVLAVRELPRRQSHTAVLQRRLWQGLRESIPYLRLNGPEPGPERLGTNLNLSPEFIEGEGVLLMADVQGLALASGTSCVSKALKISHVLEAIGLPHSLAQAAILLTLGQGNDDADIEAALVTLPKVIARLRDLSPTWDEFQRGVVDSLVSPGRRPQPQSQPC